MNLLDELAKVQRLYGDTYSSAEVLGLIGQARAEIERLRAALKEIARFCESWDNGDLDQYDAMAAIEHVLDSRLLSTESP